MDRLNASIAPDPIVCAVVAQMEEGVSVAREQAPATGYGVEELYEANRRLNRHITRVTREVAAEEAAPDLPDGESL